MEATDYCSYSLSLALKKAGFDELTNSFYNETPACLGEFEIVPTYARFNEVSKTPGCECVAAPLLYQAQKWLREVKRCDVTVYAQPYNGLPYYTGYILFEGDETEVLDDNGQWFDDYEKAMSETISAALELIKKGE